MYVIKCYVGYLFVMLYFMLYVYCLFYNVTGLGWVLLALCVVLYFVMLDY